MTETMTRLSMLIYEEASTPMRTVITVCIALGVVAAGMHVILRYPEAVMRSAAEDSQKMVRPTLYPRYE
jgi:hypothetical protein